MRTLKQFFGIDAAGSTIRTEVVAGVTTFLTMAYIVFVNPQILGDAGMPKESVFVATCVVAAFATALMGLWANYPIACAPGMGLNAYFAYTVVGAMGYSWRMALGAVFISGLLFLLISLLGLREKIIAGIPRSLRLSITAGIGLFLAIIALKSAGIVVANPATLVSLGDLRKTPTLLAILGFFTIVVLECLKVRGGILIGILLVTGLSALIGDNHGSAHAASHFAGVVSLPPSIGPTFLQMDVAGALSTGIVHVVLVFFLVELFDATGTMMGVANRAGLLAPADGAEQARHGRDEHAHERPVHEMRGPGEALAVRRRRPDRRLSRALLADSLAIVAGAVLGTSSTTAYIESAAGVQAGGRTGLTALVVALLFVAALFFAPLAALVPPYATAPALLYVSCLMLRDLAELPWDDATEVVPAALTTLAMPFTYSIANGVAFGFIAYAVLKLLTGRAREVAWIGWIVAALFVLRYAYLGAS